MPETETRIQEILRPIVGLELCVVRMFFEIAIFQFGQVTHSTNRKGKPVAHGEFALHVFCPWRIECATGILTGGSDMWVLEDPEQEVPEGWQLHKDGSLYDARVRQLPGIYDLKTRKRQPSGCLVVQDVQCDRFGGAEVTLSDGFSLVIFPSSSASGDWKSGEEDWRFFEVHSKLAHWVVSGGKLRA